MQVEAKRPVGTGVEIICSRSEVIGPVEEVDSVPLVLDPVVKVRGPVDALTEEESMEALSLVVQAVTVDISAVEVIGPAFVDEVKCSPEKLVFFAILSVASVIYVGTGGVVDLVSEVIVSVAESIGLAVQVGPCVMDSVLEATVSTWTSLWLSDT